MYSTNRLIKNKSVNIAVVKMVSPRHRLRDITITILPYASH